MRREWLLTTEQSTSWHISQLGTNYPDSQSITLYTFSFMLSRRANINCIIYGFDLKRGIIPMKMEANWWQYFTCTFDFGELKTRKTRTKRSNSANEIPIEPLLPSGKAEGIMTLLTGTEYLFYRWSLKQNYTLTNIGNQVKKRGTWPSTSKSTGLSFYPIAVKISEDQI